MSAFCEFDHHQFSDSVPFSPGLSLSVEYHFFSVPGPKNDQRPAGNLACTQRHKCGVSNTFLFIVFNSPYDVIEHRHEDNYSLELCWGAHFVHELLDFADGLQCGESWEIFHSNSIGSPSIVSKVLYCGGYVNQPNCSSQTVFDVGF